MKVSTERNTKAEEKDFLCIYIGEVRFRVTEIDGKMKISKYNEGEDFKKENIIIEPINHNQIKIS